MTNALSMLPIGSISTVDGRKVYDQVWQLTGIIWSDLIPVDTTKNYTISWMMKSLGSVGSMVYLWLAPYDANKNFIPSEDVIRYWNDETITSYNSTSITVNQTINSWDSGQSNCYRQLLGFYYDWDTTNLPDAVMWGDCWNNTGAYSTAIGNTITLTTAIPSNISSHIIPGTTKVKNQTAGWTYLYTAAVGATVPNTWTTYSGNITGEIYWNDNNIFRKWTKYVRVLLYLNYTQSNTSEVAVDKIYFKEASTTTPDSSWNGNAGTIAWALHLWSWKIRNSTYYDGTNYISIPYSSTLNQNFSTISVWAWTKTSSCSGVGTIVWRHTDTTNAQWTLRIENGTPEFYITTSNGFNWVIGWSVCDGNWHYLVWVYDGSTVTIYVDGVAKNAINWSWTIVNKNQWTTIGTYLGWLNEQFNWAIDETKIYNRALNAAEIQAIYNAQK
jgi:hypothetical protein